MALKSPLFKICVSDLTLYEAVMTSNKVVQLKLKCLAKEANMKANLC